MALGKEVKIGVALPQVFPDGVIDMTLVRDFATIAEDMGYHSLWVQEQVMGTALTLEPLSLLSYAAGQTSSIWLGVSVLVLPLHNPMHLAKQAGSIDRISEGRLILGVGLGNPSPLYEASGLSAARRVRRFIENIEVMKSLWTEEQTRYEGVFYKLEDIPMEPKPVYKPHPPIWIGGRHPNALKRAVQYGDGWMGAGSSSIDDFKEQAALVRQYLDDARIDPSTFGVSKRIYLAIDEDSSRAERKLRDWFGYFYRNADMASQVCVWGSASHCLEKIHEVVEAGADHVLLNPVFDYLEHLEIFTKHLGPLD